MSLRDQLVRDGPAHGTVGPLHHSDVEDLLGPSPHPEDFAPVAPVEPADFERGELVWTLLNEGRVLGSWDR